MKTIRYFLVIVALLTLGGLSLLQEIGSTSLANAVASYHVSSLSTSSAAGKSFAIKRTPPCGGTYDC